MILSNFDILLKLFIAATYIKMYRGGELEKKNQDDEDDVILHLLTSSAHQI